MSAKRRIVLLFGGRSAEHDVSRMSAVTFLRALDPEKFDVLPIGISPNGEWSVSDSALALHRRQPGTESLVQVDVGGRETTPMADLEIAQMHAMKTGALIRAAIRMGAVLGGADTDVLGHVTAYAEAAGRAFQLADDILDVTADAKSLGKATQKDAGMNKQTLVARIGVDAARRHLGDIVHEAISALTPFGADARVLVEAARYFATRES